MNDTPIAPVFDIQRFSIHDGPGIRTLVFFKGCMLHCSWCQNPESQGAKPVVAFYRERCRQSYHCESVCAEHAINKAGFRVDYAKCTACGDCVDVCAYGALKLVGEKLTPGQLLDRVLTDKPYFDHGGGVTLTGGEPTLYPKFVEQFADLCKQERLHINIETSGRFSLDTWRPILGKMDLIYFDLKIFDPQSFRDNIGDGLVQIMENASYLATHGFPVEFRLALIPGYTDTQENLEATSRFLRSVAIDEIRLLEYHNMGEIKIDIIRGDHPKLRLKKYAAEELLAVQEIFERAGINVPVH